MQNSFTDEDVKKAKEFAAMLSKAELQLPLDQYPRVYGMLVWFQQATKKMEDHVMELKRIIEPPPEPVKKTRTRKKK